MRDTSKSSGSLSASTLLVTGTALLCGLNLVTDGTNAVTVTVYDNTAASGTVLATVKVKGADLSKEILFTYPVKAKTGLYASVSGTGASFTVYYA